MFKEIIKKILPIIMFILLVCGMAYFPYIPMKLFNIPYNTYNLTMRIMYTLLCDIGYMIILFLIYRKKIVGDFKEYFKDFGKNFETSFKYYFIGAIIMLVTNLILSFCVKGATANNEEAVRDLINKVPFYMAFSVSLYAPFVEELIFRHSIKDCVMCYGNNKVTRAIYIFVSGFIFAAMHVVSQVKSPLDYLYIISYMSLGLAFSALYSKTDNIFSSIMMHFLHNTVSFILLIVAGGAI